MAYTPEPINVDFEYVDNCDYRILPTHWFDGINTISSSYSIRRNFGYINEFYIEGATQASYTTRTQPFRGYGDCFVNDIAKNYLSFDENWFTHGTLGNPNSFKDAAIHYGEGFSRRLDLTSIESFTYSHGSTQSTIIKIYFPPGQCLLEGSGSAQDRILLVKTDDINESYNTYAKVLSSSSINGWIIVDIPFIDYPYPQTGYFYEGVEFIDYRYSSDGATVETTLNHNFNVGDQIVIQMDTHGRASVEITGSIGQTLDSITLDGVNLMSYSVTFTSTLENFIDGIVASIEDKWPVDSFWAYRNTTVLYIFTNRRTDSFYEGMGLTYSGTINSFTSSTVRYLQGYDELGHGLNPQITGYYNIKSILSPTTFTLDRFLPVYYNNEIGSDRGTIYSLTDYKFYDLTISSTFSYLFASIDTQNDIEPIDNLSGVLGNFVTIDNPLPYYLSARNIIGNESVDTFKANIYDVDFYNTSEVFTIDILNSDGFTMSSPYGIDSFVVNRIFATYSDTVTFSNANYLDEKVTLGFGPWNLNEFYLIDPGSVTTFVNPGSDPNPIPEEIISYSISAYNTDSFTPKKVTKTLNFFKKCTDKQVYQLCWLNEWGGWDYYTFFSPLNKTFKFGRNNFYKNGNYRNGVVQETSSPKSRGETSFKLDRTLELKLFTDYLTLNESKLIESLISSPTIYLIKANNPHDISNHLIYPVEILNEELKLHSPVSKMRFYEIDIRMAGYNYYNRQPLN